MAIHGALFEQYAEHTAREPFARQNSKLLKVTLGRGPIWAKAGSMVAYQGEVRFENKGSGVWADCSSRPRRARACRS